MSLLSAVMAAAIDGNHLSPKLSKSDLYKHWISIEDMRRCFKCKGNHGKIWNMDETPVPEPPIHPNCRCEVVAMQSIQAGTATINKTSGADWMLLYNGGLPEYYVSFDEALRTGWKRGKWPSNFIPGKMITMGIYHNRDGHLPQALGRIWYEADINYTTGKRNTHRILWSNDGLIFVTYDHYRTFYEVVKAEK